MWFWRCFVVVHIWPACAPAIPSILQRFRALVEQRQIGGVDIPAFAFAPGGLAYQAQFLQLGKGAERPESFHSSHPAGPAPDWPGPAGDTRAPTAAADSAAAAGAHKPDSAPRPSAIEQFLPSVAGVS